jgi:hypothetical protein
VAADDRVLTQRELNRALLARQLLLDRVRVPLLLAHARRTGILPEEHRQKVFNIKTPQSVHTFLVDGVVAGTWKHEKERVKLELFGRLDKTAAGTGREVDLLPAPRDELAVHKASAERSEAADLVFATGPGNAENPSNIRNRVFAPAIRLANERRAEAGLPPLPVRVTQHSMRRTVISVLFALGYELPVVMAQVGHSDGRLTLNTYARVMLRGEDERARLRALVEGARAPDTDGVPVLA